MTKKRVEDSKQGSSQLPEKRPVPPQLAQFAWKPGQCGTPAELTKVRTETAGILLALLHSPDEHGRRVNAQRFLDACLKSEYLMGRLLDKMMPTLTPEQVNIIAGSFEQRILQMNGGVSPHPAAPSVEEPTTERGPFEGHVEKIVEAVGADDPGAMPATPAVMKPTPKRAGA